jgi:hypothetical protein
MAKWSKAAQIKMDSGEWTPVPWHNEEWYKTREVDNQHFAHISLRDSGHVAHVIDYDEAEDKMRIISGKPGRYLSKFYSDTITASLIRSYANKIAIEAGAIEIKFAATPEEIQKVYEDGPRSCMSREATYYKAKIHPCSIYGAGDLSVAYMQNKSGGIISRTICWPNQEVFSCIYGDGGEYSGIMKDHLVKTLGWIQDSDGLEGAKCLKIKYGAGYVAPYLDGSLGFDVVGDHLIVRQDAEYQANSENGVIAAGCYICNDSIDGAEYDFNGETYCECCWSEVAFNCNECNDVHSLNDSYDVDNGWGSRVCEHCFDNLFIHAYVKCDETHEAPDGLEYCDDCIAEHIDTCDDCGTEESPSDIYESTRDFRRRCESCNADHDDKYDNCRVCADEVETTELSDGVCCICTENRDLSGEENLEMEAQSG